MQMITDLDLIDIGMRMGDLMKEGYKVADLRFWVSKENHDELHKRFDGTFGFNTFNGIEYFYHIPVVIMDIDDWDIIPVEQTTACPSTKS